MEQEIKDMNVCQAWNTMKSKVFGAMEQCIPKLGTSKTREKKHPGLELMWQPKSRKRNKHIIETWELVMVKITSSTLRPVTRQKMSVEMQCEPMRKTVAHEAKKNPKKLFAYTKTKMKTEDGVADLNDSGQSAESIYR